MIESNFRSKKYNVADAICILNPLQAAFYWINGVEPVDIYPSIDFKTHKPVVVYVFSKIATQNSGVYNEWCNRQGERENGSQ